MRERRSCPSDVFKLLDGDILGGVAVVGTQLAITLTAHVLNQRIHLVFEVADGTGADVERPQLPSSDEQVVEGGLANAEALKHLTLAQNAFSHKRLSPITPRSCAVITGSVRHLGSS